MKQTYRWVAFAGAVAGVLSLAACSNEQSVAEACEVAEEVITTAFDEVESQLESTFIDVGYGIDVDFDAMFGPVNEAIAEATEIVSNAEVQSALVEFRDGFAAFTAAVASADIPEISAENMSDPEAFEEQSAALEAFSMTVQTQAMSLQESSQSVEALCDIN